MSKFHFHYFIQHFCICIFGDFISTTENEMKERKIISTDKKFNCVPLKILLATIINFIQQSQKPIMPILMGVFVQEFH